VPNLGLTPLFNSTPLSGLASNLANVFDQTVLSGLSTAEQTGLKVFDLNTYSLLTDVVNNPSAFGFNDAADPCWTGSFSNPGSGTLCAPTVAEQDKFVFWDHVHPTEAAQLLVAEDALNALSAVPEPSTWALMMLGLIGVVFVGHRRSKDVYVRSYR
jgi:outer membrane lipase/esterase